MVAGMSAPREVNQEHHRSAPLRLERIGSFLKWGKKEARLSNIGWKLLKALPKKKGDERSYTDMNITGTNYHEARRNLVKKFEDMGLPFDDFYQTIPGDGVRCKEKLPTIKGL